jgi:type IV secretory pathway VirB4 component
VQYLGNTGSGKSCTITSLLQSIYISKDKLINAEPPNLKTIIIDSNNEYSEIFDGKAKSPSWV